MSGRGHERPLLGAVAVAGRDALSLREPTRAALVAGVALFDAGRFFEAHEVWEDAWRVEQGETRVVLQGLIQIAAGFHKGLVQQRPGGMAKLLRTGLDRLGHADALGPVALGPLRAEVERWRDAASAWGAGGERPALARLRLAGR